MEENIVNSSKYYFSSTFLGAIDNFANVYENRDKKRDKKQLW